MILDGIFYTEKSKEYDEKLKHCIEESLKKLEGTVDTPLMMLGRIQSGKTRAFIGVISLAFDNGYDLSIVLTKNSKALVKQTTARMNREFRSFIDNDHLGVYDVMVMPDALSKYEINRKIILVVKKQHENLPVLLDFLKRYSFEGNKKCLIIDDEADFTSVGFQKNKDDEEFDLRKIASQINELRVRLSYKFVQVTATPYSLYLQPESVTVRGERIEPIKPFDTVLVPFGEGYVGGDYYFDDHVNPHKDLLFSEIDFDELEILKSSDRRRLKEEESLTSRKISGLRASIFNFIIGACIRIIQNGGEAKGSKNKFSFLVHTETKKSSHSRQFNLIEEMVKQIEIEARRKSDLIEEYINNSIQEMITAVSAHGFDVPSIQEIKDTFYRAIEDGWIKSVLVNSENQIDTLLDDNGQLKLRVPMTIFVGGQILDRGVTIENMIGFYYGRRPQKMQQDTVLQHSRMFGYRDKRDLAVTKFYTTVDLYERMARINEFDSRLRFDIENGNNQSGVIFLAIDDEHKVIPCSPQKILLTKTKVIRSHERILPVGFKNKPITYSRKCIGYIDQFISDKCNGNLKGEFTISKQDALKLLNNAYDCLDIENPYTVDKQRFITILDYLSKENVHIIARDKRNIKKHRKSRYYSDMPDNRDGDLKPARKMAKEEPAIIMLRQEGLKEDDWSGAPFWWPVMVIQENAETSVFSLGQE